MNVPAGLPKNPTMRDLSRWAERMRGQGMPICICAQGTVDVPVPTPLLQRLERSARETTGHRYPPQIGSRELRSAFARDLVERERIITTLRVDEESAAGLRNNLLVCSGVNGGFIAALHFIKARFGPEARCAVIDPSYLYHDLDVLAVFGRGAVHVPSTDEWGLDRRAIEEALASGVRALLVCNPANPHGLLLDDEELRFLVDVTARYGAFVLFDEVYAHILEPGQRFRSPLHLFEELPSHVIVVRGWSKLLGMQGDRVGMLIAHEETLPAVLRWHDVVYIGVNAAAQLGLAAYLAQDPSDLERHTAELNQIIQRNSELAAQAYEAAFGWKMDRGARTGRSTIYRMIRHDRETDQEAMLHSLAHGIAAAPGNVFFGPRRGDPLTGEREPRTGTLRLSLAMPTEALKAGADQLRSGKRLF
ncbi:MAG: pyridoxal phosphate-dependent aminotransferase [Myxococcota bacterium]|nr:pyridoxal phosphate-dependent aminotransferase [Myxococcota bacterium]